MPHGAKFHLNSELTDFFFRYASPLLVMLLRTLEQKFSDNGAFANYVFQYIGDGDFIFHSFRSRRALVSCLKYIFFWNLSFLLTQCS